MASSPASESAPAAPAAVVVPAAGGLPDGVDAPARRGSLIVFEGVDRCGKTTQSKKLIDTLNDKGVPSKPLNFPDRTTAVGKLLDSYLRKEIELEDHAVHLLFAANRWERKDWMLEQLGAGVSLVVDRYSFSGVAFSAQKDSMEFGWCWQPEIGLPKPDVVLFMSLPEEKQAERGGFGEERYERTDVQKRVRAEFQKMWDEDTWVRVDAARTIEEVHGEIMGTVGGVLERAGGDPVRYFER